MTKIKFNHENSLIYEFYLLSDLLEAVQHRNTGYAVYLTERVQTHWVEMMLTSYSGILDDSTG